ncbi:hypothetical protein [Coprococcus comes]|uniref:hypothetical protein n=1 Tax=Coprococcus comes TaxID=410072 RepID=UPI003D79B5DB
MATNYLDTGDTGRAVSAESDGALFAGIFGSAKYVLENGSQLKAEVQSNNIVKISDGDAVMYGRHVRIPANDSALVTINNGHSGTNRIDLIVFRYTKDSTGKETVDLVVIQGEDSTGTATAPTAVDGNILTGAMQSDFPLYSVELNGINIVKVNPLFNVIGNISKLKEELTELNSNLKTATADSGWKYMINANNLSEKLKFRKIGHVVFVSGSIRFLDGGKFANDQALGSVPSGMTPNGYGDFECLIPIAMHNGGPAGTQARIYIKNGGVYIVGTDSASFVMIATTAYFS